MWDAARIARATPVLKEGHKFYPQGASAIVILEESHISIHTWPEYNYAELDVYTCGEHVYPERAFEFLRDFFKPEAYDLQVIYRGPKNLVEKFKPGD